MLRPQVSMDIIFSQNAHTASQDALHSHPHNLCHYYTFILVGKITDPPSKIIKIVLNGVGGHGEEDLKEGIAGVL